VVQLVNKATKETRAIVVQLARLAAKVQPDQLVAKVPPDRPVVKAIKEMRVLLVPLAQQVQQAHKVPLDHKVILV
jgi:hypothetical protein